ncbi:MAG: hypothetical protein C0490_14205 [Marivirga sp.]|nr:hypothetical protein [Marivirga sp.]
MENLSVQNASISNYSARKNFKKINNAGQPKATDYLENYIPVSSDKLNTHTIPNGLDLDV